MLRSLTTATLLSAAYAFHAPVGRHAGVASRAAVGFAPAVALPRLHTPLHMQEASDAKEAEVASAAKAVPAEDKDGVMETLVTGAFFGLWYLFNIGYNIYNKKALNALPIPYSMAVS